MRKSPWWYIRWIGGSVALAVQQPASVRHAKMWSCIWGSLLVVTILIATMGLLIRPLSWFTFGFVMVALPVYAVALKWSINGFAYAKRMEERREFDAMVAEILSDGR